MRWIFGLIALMLQYIVSAQSPLSLDDCIALAKEKNKRILATSFQVRSAAYGRKALFSNFLPTLSVEALGAYSTADGSLAVEGGVLPVVGVDGVPTGGGAYFPGINLDYKIGWLYGAGLKITQPIFMGGKVIAGYKMGRIGEAVALQNRRLTMAEVVVETARAYANVVQAVELQRVVAAYYRLLNELMRSVEKGFQRGVKLRNDVLKVEVRLDESRLNLHRAENAIRLAKMNLCHYIGRVLTDSIEVDGALPAIDYPHVLSADISSRPEVQLLSHKSELMRQEINLERSELLPKIGVVGQFGYLDGVRFAGSKLFDDWNFAAGLQLSIPIFNLGAHSRYRSAKMEYLQTLACEEAAIEQLTLELTQAANNLEESRMEQSLAERGVASAAENLRVSNRQYEAGVESLTNLLEAQALWQQSSRMLVKARVNYFLRWIEYRKAIGDIE